MTPSTLRITVTDEHWENYSEALLNDTAFSIFRILFVDYTSTIFENTILEFPTSLTQDQQEQLGLMGNNLYLTKEYIIQLYTTYTNFLIAKYPTIIVSREYWESNKKNMLSNITSFEYQIVQIIFSEIVDIEDISIRFPPTLTRSEYQTILDFFPNAYYQTTLLGKSDTLLIDFNSEYITKLYLKNL